jgi:hypothetical protein
MFATAFVAAAHNPVSVEKPCADERIVMVARCGTVTVPRKN